MPFSGAISRKCGFSTAAKEQRFYSRFLWRDIKPFEASGGKLLEECIAGLEDEEHEDLARMAQTGSRRSSLDSQVAMTKKLAALDTSEHWIACGEKKTGRLES